MMTQFVCPILIEEKGEESLTFNCLLDSLTAQAQHRKQIFWYAEFNLKHLKLFPHICGKLMSTSRTIFKLKLSFLFQY